MPPAPTGVTYASPLTYHFAREPPDGWRTPGAGGKVEHVSRRA